MSWLGSTKLAMKYKILYSTIIVVLVLSTAIMLRDLALFLQPFSPPKIQEPIPVEKSQVARGDAQRFIASYVKTHNADALGVLVMKCDDGSTIPLESVRTNIPIGTGTLYSLPIVIPNNAPGGECYIRIRVRFEVNQNKIVYQEYDTQKFEVL